MPRLFVLSGDDVGHTHDFDTALTLGRAKDADMRMRGASISRKHARIEPEGDGWKVTDLGSANGVYVDSRRVESALLEDGAEFRLGDVELRLRTTLPAIMVPKPAPIAPTFEESAAQTQMVPGAAPPEPQTVPEPELEPAGDDGFELEGDWSDEPPPPLQVAKPRPAAASPAPSSSAPARPAAAAARAAETASRRADALGQTAGAAGARTTTSGKRILQFNKVANRGGLGGSELAQQPALVRWLLYALAAAVFAGLAWGAFELTRGMRASSGPNVDQDF